METTFVMIKPDGVERGLISEVIGRFERRGLKMVGGRFLQPSLELAQKHYSVHSERPFFTALIEFITSGPVFAMAWKGKDAIGIARFIIGATNPAEAAPGTIRGDYALDIGRNIVHGSDGQDTAMSELNLWFPDGLTVWQPTRESHIYE